MVCLVSRSRC